MPASATYGRLMPRGAGFATFFAALSSSDSTALSPSSQIRASDVRRFRSAQGAKQSGQSRQGGDEGGFYVQFPGVLPE